MLRRLLHNPELENKYDYILIDCKPSLDLLVGNSLAAADSLIVPVQPDDYSLDGLGDLMDTIDGIRDKYNDGLTIAGILVTLATMSRKTTQQTIAQLKDAFGNLVFDTVLPNLADIANAKEKGLTSVTCGNRLGKLYIQLAEEAMSR